MTYKTRGIVLHHIKYSETSVIAKVYTEQFGIQSYLINRVRSRSSKIKANVFQPLSLMEMVVYHKENGGLQRVNEVTNSHLFTSIPYDIAKCSIAFFIAEILYRSIREEEANSSLFQFLFNSIQILDLTTSNCANFHLIFMLQLTKHLGFYPNGNYTDKNKYFDLKDGTFLSEQPQHPHYMTPGLSECLSQLLRMNFESFDSFKINKNNRKSVLVKLIEYYELHLIRMKEVKSHLVLESVL
ncbi:MAG: DNA repair protein RecO [Bacteroidota bacterium]